MKNKTFINDIKSHGYKLITIPNGIKDYFEFMDSDGYKYYSYYNAIYKTWNPKKFGKNNKFSLYNINVFLRNSNINTIKCLEDGQYNYSKIWFKCECGNVFCCNLSNFFKSTIFSCPICSAKRAGKKNIDKKYLKFIKKYNLELYQEEYLGCKNKTYFKDEDGYIVCGTLYNAMRMKNFDGFKHSRFNQYNKYCIENLKLWINKNGGSTEIVNFDNARGVTLRCEDCGEEYDISLFHFMHSKKFICNRCSLERKKKRTSDRFEYEGSLYEKYNLKLLEPYRNRTTPILCETKEGYRIYESPTSLRIKNNCYSKVFHASNAQNVIYNLNMYIKNNDIKTQLISTKYISSHSKLKFKCSCGNIFSKTLNYFVSGYNVCSNCSNKNKSRLERTTQHILDKLGIKYMCQCHFDDCKDKNVLPFDFYLPEHNICIECQGIQHFEPVDYFGGDEALEYTQKHDKIKRVYCNDNNIKLLYICYNDKIDKIKNLIKNALKE